MECRMAGLPAPQPVRGTERPYPKIAATIFVQADRASSWTTIVAVAFTVAAPNHAERPFEVEVRDRPNRTLMILDKLKDETTCQGVIERELPVFQGCEPTFGADPQRSVACHQKTADVARRQWRALHRLPRNGPHAVEAKQAVFRAKPQIPVRCLRNRGDRALEEPVADRPGGVRVLTDVERWIECERGRRPHQQRRHESDGSQRCARSVAPTHRSRSLCLKRRVAPLAVLPAASVVTVPGRTTG